MRLNDGLLGLLLLLVAAAMAYASSGFPAVPGQQYGASAFPTIIALGFGGCGVSLIASSLRTRDAPWLEWSEWARSPRGRINVLATVAAIVFYVVAARTLGFMPTMALILLVLLRLFGVGWTWTLLLAVAAPVAMQYLFGRLLLVPLPWGVLSPVRWW
jgi:putative tricarboxylic transport membrane protein